MQKLEFFLSEAIYRKYLSVINEVKFTPREIDIISCIVHGKNVKSIAKFLSTDEKSVGSRAIDTHILNIRRKIRGSSKESIIDFIEGSHKYQATRKYYLSILIQREFNKSLRQISALTDLQNHSFLIITRQEADIAEDLINIMRYCIESIGCRVSVEILENGLENAHKFPVILHKEQIKYVIYAAPASITAANKLDYIGELTQIAKNTSSDFLFLLPGEDNSSSTGNLGDFKYITIGKEAKPYFLFFAILKNFFPGLTSINDIEKDFLARYETIEAYPSAIDIETASKQAIISPPTDHLIKPASSSGSIPFGKIYYRIVAILILTSMTAFIFSRYFFRESDYSQTSYEKIEEQINEFGVHINSYKDIENIEAGGSYILSLRKALDDLYNKYPQSLNMLELQSKFNYLTCILADYYRYNAEYRNSEPAAYLKEQYPKFKWFKNIDPEKFYDYVAAAILERVLNHYNNKYNISDDGHLGILEAKTEGFDYVLQDYILLNYRLADGYMRLDVKDRSADYTAKILERYLSVAALGTKYNMIEGYLAEKNLLIIGRDKLIKALSQTEHKLKQTFPMLKNETSLISVVNKINLSSGNKQLVKKIMDDELPDAEIEMTELRDIKNGFKILQGDNRQYIKFYAPWKKHDPEAGRELLVPKNSFYYRLSLCTEILRTETVLMDYNILAYHDNPEKLRQLQSLCLENCLRELVKLLDYRKIPEKNYYAEVKIEKLALAKLIKSLAEHYHDEEISAELKKIGAMICYDKFDHRLKSRINRILQKLI